MNLGHNYLGSISLLANFKDAMILNPQFRDYIHELKNMRNTFAHDPSFTDKNITDYYEELNPEHQKQFCKAILFDEDEPEKLIHNQIPDRHYKNRILVNALIIMSELAGFVKYLEINSEFITQLDEFTKHMKESENDS